MDAPRRPSSSAIARPMPRDPPVTRHVLPDRSAMAEPPRPGRNGARWPTRSPATSEVIQLLDSALAGLGRVRDHLDRGLPALERRLLGSLDDLGELLDCFSIALQAEVKHVQPGVHRGILCIE